MRREKRTVQVWRGPHVDAGRGARIGAGDGTMNLITYDGVRTV